MSSARNHAKRSHRSEHFKKSVMGTSARKAWMKNDEKPKRLSFFEKIFSRYYIRNDKTV